MELDKHGSPHTARVFVASFVFGGFISLSLQWALRSASLGAAYYVLELNIPVAIFPSRTQEMKKLPREAVPE